MEILMGLLSISETEAFSKELEPNPFEAVLLNLFETYTFFELPGIAN